MSPGDLLNAILVDILTCIVFLGAFIYLRRTRSCGHIYASRKEAGAVNADTDGDTRPCPTSTGIVSTLRTLLSVSEEQVLQSIGLDGLAFIRLHTFAIQLFSVIGIVSFIVILPANMSGANGLHYIAGDRWDLRMTMAHLVQESKLLWVHLLTSWAFTFITLKLLLFHTERLLRLRIEFLYLQNEREPAVQHYSVLVMDLPAPEETQPLTRLARAAHQLTTTLGADRVLEAVGMNHDAVNVGATEAEVRAFFEAIYPGAVQSCVMVPQAPDVKAAWQRVLTLRNTIAGSADGDAPVGCCKMLLWQRPPTSTLLDATSQAEVELEVMERDLEELQDVAANRRAHTAFVTFNSRAVASIASSNVAYAPNGHAWKVAPAPAPGMVIWEALRLVWWQRHLRNAASAGVMTWGVIFFMIPVTFVSTLTTADSLKKKVQFLKPVVDMPLVRSFLEGYMPAVVLACFMMALPSILRRLSIWEAASTSKQQLQLVTSTKYYFILVFNVFLGSVLTQSIFRDFENIIHHFSFADLVEKLGVYVPSTSVFFATYTAFRALNSLPLELLQIGPLLCHYLCCCSPNHKHQPRLSMPYEVHVPGTSLVLLLGLVYCVVAPLVLPFVLLYFAVGRLVWHYQLEHTYCSGTKTDSEGRLWMHMVGHCHVGLVVAQLTLIGIFFLKLSPIVTLMMPLPFITLYSYMNFRIRFAKAFDTIPLSSTVLDKTGTSAPEFGAMDYQPPYMHRPQSPGITFSGTYSPAGLARGAFTESTVGASGN